MSLPPDTQRRLSAWLDDEMSIRAPDHLASDVLAAAGRTPRRPAWRIPERWFPMPLTLRLAVVPRALIIILLLALLASALLAGGIIVGSVQRAVSPPPPTGLARNGLIAYADLGDIWLVDERGEQRQQLTSGTDADFTGVWSPDGTLLAFWSVAWDGDPTRAESGQVGNLGELSLKVVGLGDREPRTLVSGLSWSGLCGMDLAWAPDSSEIAFAHRVSDDDFVGRRIDVVSVDDGSVRQLVRNGVAPGWSPDGQTIGYADTDYRTDPDGARTQGGGVSVIAASGTDTPRPLSRAPGAVTSGGSCSFHAPHWSPDGERVAFHDGRRIWIAQADGSGEVLVTTQSQQELFPQWSPDGSRLLFTRASGPRGVSVITDPDGTDESVLDDPATYWLERYWSPDGTKVVAIADGWAGVVIQDATGSAPPVLVPASTDYGLGDFGRPSWQPLVP